MADDKQINDFTAAAITSDNDALLFQSVGGVTSKVLWSSIVGKIVSSYFQAGDNVTITQAGNVLTISATGGGSGSTYTAGDGIDITNNEISVKLGSGLSLNTVTGNIDVTGGSGGGTKIYVTDTEPSSPATDDVWLHTDAANYGDIDVYNGAAWVTQANMKGADGDDGQPGQDGVAATIAVGTVTTGEAGTSASITNSGTSSDAVFDFVIPRGATGEQGETGAQGYSISATVTTITGGHRVTLHSTDPEASDTYFDVMDGSGSGSTYTAGDGIDITSNAISVKVGDGLTINQITGNIDVTSSGTTYTAGDGIDISNDEISFKVGNGLQVNSTTGNVDVVGGGAITPGKGLEFNSSNELEVTQTVRNQITTAGTYTLTASGWSNSLQKVTCALDVNKRNVIDVTLGSLQNWGQCGVRPTLEESDGITFTYDTLPTSDLTFYVTSMRVKDITVPAVSGLDYLFNSEDMSATGGTITWNNQGSTEDSDSIVWTGATLQSDGAILTTGGSSSGGKWVYSGNSDITEYTIYLVYRIENDNAHRVLEMAGGNSAYSYTSATVYNSAASYNGETTPDVAFTQSLDTAVLAMKTTIDELTHRIKVYYNGEYVGMSNGYVPISPFSPNTFWNKFGYGLTSPSENYYFYEFGLAKSEHSDATVVANSQKLMAKYGIEVS